MSDKTKTILITIEIGDFDKGKRKVTLSGAPVGEMPIVKTGTFAELHHLIDVVWIELAKRQPQLVTVKEDKKTKPATAKPKAGDGDEAEETETAETAKQACRVCGCTDDNPCPEGCSWVEPDLCSTCADKAKAAAEPQPEPPADLPVIGNDPTASTETQTTFLEESNG